MAIKVAGYAPRLTWDTLPGKPTVFPPAVHTHAWGDITGKPSSFAPAAHTHAYNELTGVPTSFAPSAHTHTWADITGKPVTFTPAAHTHSYNDLTDKPTIPTAGRLVSLGNVTVSETTLLALGLGTKRMALTLTGVVANEPLFFAPRGVATAGCEALNVYASAANQVTVSYFTPALGIGATYSIPVTIYRVSA